MIIDGQLNLNLHIMKYALDFTYIIHRSLINIVREEKILLYPLIFSDWSL